MIVRNMDTHSASVFKCNQWFSKTEGEGKLIKELPAETDGEEMLSSKLFLVEGFFFNPQKMHSLTLVRCLSSGFRELIRNDDGDGSSNATKQ